MAELTILVPRREDGGWRDELWTYCREHWAGQRIIEGTDNGRGPFNRSRAVNLAALEAGRLVDVLVIADADTIVDTGHVVEAERVARTTGRLVLAWDQLLQLDRHGTKRILNGEPGSWRGFIRSQFSGGVSSCLAIPRDLFDACGGFDERFEGWGYEDRAFFITASTLGGPALRLCSPAWHLWHPRSPERNDAKAEYRANQDLVARYKAANGDRAAVQQLIDER